MHTVLIVAVFLGTYAVMALGRAPGLRIDRVGAAFLGAALMVALGGLSLDAAYAAIDFDTLALLLGMMVVVANLRLSGCFAVATAWVARRARWPLLLLAGVVGVSGVLSAVLVNDTVCLALTPLVLDVVLRLRRDPVPYAVAVALASNVGSTATITGNPQNMIIGSLSHLPYGTFAAALAPVAAAGLMLVWTLVAALWWREFRPGTTLHATPAPVRLHGAMAAQTLAVTAALVAAFFLGVRPAEAALLGGAALLVTRGVKPHRIYREIDWTLLLMFAGLFVVAAGFERAVLTPEAVAGLRLNSMPVLAGVTAVLSNVVSNVPAVLLIKPFVPGLADPDRAWKVIAMAATLAGNFSILGSVANLIVVQQARARGVTIGFWTYFAVGAPLTVLSIGIGLLRL